jgi:hypothetical protein
LISIALRRAKRQIKNFKMKTRNLFLLGWLLLALPAGAQAQFTCFTNQGAITITGYSGTNGSAIIPATLNGYPVTGIDNFYSPSSLTNITVPDSVTNIVNGAFDLVYNLNAILVDPQNAYYSSSNGFLLDKAQMVLIEAPPGITGSNAIPASVTSILGSAFAYCFGLSGVTIPGGITNIGPQAFYGCSSLTGIAVGPNVINIGSQAFAACSSLAAITVDAKNLFYRSVNGVLFDHSQSTLLQAPGELAGSYAIPAGITSIGTGAFSFCNSLTAIMMPDSVTNLLSEAFGSCGSLTNLTLSTSLVSIGDLAFGGCLNLTSLAIPNGVTSIGELSFESCSGLTNLTLGTNVVSINYGAFSSCSRLVQLLIPNSVTNLGSTAFAECGSLAQVTLETNLVNIGAAAFQNCASLTGIAIPASTTNLGTGVFAGCGSLVSIAVDPHNPSYTSVGGALCNKLQTSLIQVPGGFAGSYAVLDSVTNIAYGALAGCGRLSAITVGAQNADFSAVNGVLFDKPQTTLIQFPAAVGGAYTVPTGTKQLGFTAFYECSNLTSITIPSGVTNVGNTAFLGCSSTEIFFQGNAPAIASPDLPSISSPGLIRPIVPGNNFYNPDAEAVYYLPGTTGWGATFEGLTAYLWDSPFVCITVGNSITIYGFNGSVGAITIPDTINGLPVTALAAGLFDNAAGYGLTNVILGTNLTSIGNDAFAACANLTTLDIPNGVTNLGSGAFAFCDSLKSVYFQGNAPAVGSDVFFQWSSFFPFSPPVYEPPTPTTVYYLPGTTGWGATFGGQPAILWNPQPQTGDADFGVRNHQFGFNITGTSNLTFVVEAATNLLRPDWQPVQTITLTTGPAYFSDSQWTNYPGRFYRLRSP